MVMGFFAFVNFFTLRVNLSVAIVDMVNATYLREIDAAAASVAAMNISSSGQQHLDSSRLTVNSSTLTDGARNVSAGCVPLNRYLD